MTEFSSYLSAICSAKKNIIHSKKDELFAMVAKVNSNSISSSNKKLLISRSTLTRLLVEKLILPHLFVDTIHLK